MRRAIIVAIIVACISSGCGTVRSISNASESDCLVYSGVKEDLQKSSAWSIVDLPFSFIVDTVIFPFAAIQCLVDSDGDEDFDDWGASPYDGESDRMDEDSFHDDRGIDPANYSDH